MEGRGGEFVVPALTSILDLQAALVGSSRKASASILSACQRSGKNSITSLIALLTSAQKTIRALSKPLPPATKPTLILEEWRA
jgi:hypothetical protein